MGGAQHLCISKKSPYGDFGGCDDPHTMVDHDLKGDDDHTEKMVERSVRTKGCGTFTYLDKGDCDNTGVPLHSDSRRGIRDLSHSFLYQGDNQEKERTKMSFPQFGVNKTCQR